MQFILILQAVIMGIVEGVTEFLPISSTGHLILTAQLLDFWTIEKRELFEVAVQLGAIAAVVYEYWGRLWQALMGALRFQQAGLRFMANVIAASLPIVIVGLLFGSELKHYLFNAKTVAAALIIGGFIILWAERKPRHVQVAEVEQLSIRHALVIGVFQCLALMPGVSRSGTTIVVGLLSGISRKAAAEFSFFLGVPVLVGAGLLDLVQSRALIDMHTAFILLVGIGTAFISALIVIRVLIRYVSSHSFVVFAWYRIIFGLLVLATFYLGWIQW